MRRAAFSLVELLAILGIIAMLTAILMPTLTKARQAAQQTQCAANLRQLGQALMMYVSNNAGYLPGWSGWHNIDGSESGMDDLGPAWTQMLQSYYVAPTNRVFNCPSFPPGFVCNYFLESRWIALQGKNFYQMTDIRHSSEFILSGDCTDGHLYPEPFGWAKFTINDIDKDDATDPALVFLGEMGSSPEDRAGINMHPGGNNVLFADGHVKVFREFNPQAMTFDPKDMRSWDEVRQPQ